jgi:non-ribosomal peptide synthetase component F
MEHLAVHRIVEVHAAINGHAPAIISGEHVTTYGDLNSHANALARHLIDEGFCRGGHARIDMRPGAELAAVLLAVLKAGGAYTWLRSSIQPTCQAAVAHRCDHVPLHPRQIDLRPMLAPPACYKPNLPILTRSTDIACVLVDDTGAPFIEVPHATIAALHRPGLGVRVHTWAGDPTTFDLWIGLMAGATLTVAAAPTLKNAA